MRLAITALTTLPYLSTRLYVTIASIGVDNCHLKRYNNILRIFLYYFGFQNNLGCDCSFLIRLQAFS